MSKQTRQQRKEEERRVIEQMKAALAEADAREQSEQSEQAQTPNQGETHTPPAQPQKQSVFDVTPQVLHCKRCKTEMKNGKCPTCGFEMYVPMSKEKRDKIKLYATIVAMAIFVVIFIITRLK